MSAGIRFFTDARTTHISMLLMEVRAREPRWLIMEAWEGGHGWFSGEVGDNFLSKKLREYEGRCYWHDLAPALDPYREAIVAELWELMGTPYDYRSLVAQVAGPVEVDAGALFCSETAQLVLHRAIPRHVLACFPWTDEMRMVVYCNPAMQPKHFENLPILMPGLQISL